MILRTDEGIHRKWKPNTDHRSTTMASQHIFELGKRVPEGIYEESISMCG